MSRKKKIKNKTLYIHMHMYETLMCKREDNRHLENKKKKKKTFVNSQSLKKIIAKFKTLKKS
jgi:tRNA G10  N-methylase Trm11